MWSGRGERVRPASPGAGDVEATTSRALVWSACAFLALREGASGLPAPVMHALHAQVPDPNPLAGAHHSADRRLLDGRSPVPSTQ